MRQYPADKPLGSRLFHRVLATWRSAMQKCSRCQGFFPLTEFPSLGSRKCKECYRAWQEEKMHYKKGVDKREMKRQRHPRGIQKHNDMRLSPTAQKFGLTLEQVLAMKAKQGNKCAICTRRRILCLDHNHSSGKIRGFLCRRCNLFVGLLETFRESAYQTICTRTLNYIGSRRLRISVSLRKTA